MPYHTDIKVTIVNDNISEFKTILHIHSSLLRLINKFCLDTKLCVEDGLSMETPKSFCLMLEVHQVG